MPTIATKLNDTVDSTLKGVTNTVKELRSPQTETIVLDADPALKPPTPAVAKDDQVPADQTKVKLFVAPDLQTTDGAVRVYAATPEEALKMISKLKVSPTRIEPIAPTTHQDIFPRSIEIQK